MSLRNTERVVLGDLREAGFDTAGLAEVEEKRIALQGVQKAAAILEEEIHRSVSEQKHQLTAPEGQVFIVKRVQSTVPTDPPVEYGHYSLSTRDRTELSGSFRSRIVLSQEAEPFTAERIEASRDGFMAVMGEEYRLINFGYDTVQLEQQAVE